MQLSRKPNPLVSLLALLLAVLCLDHLQAQSLRQPAYPVFGILQTDPQLRSSASALEGPDAFAPLCQYRMIYTSESAALAVVRDGRQQARCRPPVLVYMGGFTTNPGGATQIEKGYRQAVAMIDVTAPPTSTQPSPTTTSSSASPGVLSCSP